MHVLWIIKYYIILSSCLTSCVLLFFILIFMKPNRSAHDLMAKREQQLYRKMAGSCIDKEKAACSLDKKAHDVYAESAKANFCMKELLSGRIESHIVYHTACLN